MSGDSVEEHSDFISARRCSPAADVEVVYSVEEHSDFISAEVHRLVSECRRTQMRMEMEYGQRST